MFGNAFNPKVTGVVWPTSLEQLTFGRGFEAPLEDVEWLTSLQRLTVVRRLHDALQGLSARGRLILQQG